MACVLGASDDSALFVLPETRTAVGSIGTKQSEYQQMSSGLTVGCIEFIASLVRI